MSCFELLYIVSKRHGYESENSAPVPVVGFSKIKIFKHSSRYKMANRTVKDARTVKGTNPQYLVEKIIRTRIYESKYWKEECFALSG